MKRNLSADIFCDSTGKQWSLIIREHPAKGGDGVVVFEKHGMRTEHNVTVAMDSFYAHQEEKDNG